MNEARSKAQAAVAKGKCVSLAGLPIGCGKNVSADDFRDDLSRREYKISGLCQSCQDTFEAMFGDE
ncbi:hypothetical protein SEA_ENYGMA_212 [Streptomyces phage Enygma]